MNILKKTLIVATVLYIFSLLFSTSYDLNQDLGRHIKLGETIVKTFKVPSINLFSYTNTHFPFINHHWLSEVIFYFSTSHFGLNSLVLLKILLVGIGLSFLLQYSMKQSGIAASVLAFILLSPLLLERLQVRPELFGYVSFSILLYILLSYPKTSKFLWMIPVLMFIWINTHISFIFGLFLLLLFLPRILLQRRRVDIFFFIMGFFVLLINPNGLKGILHPFLIFKNYGYSIAENQSPFLLNRLFFSPFIRYFFLISPLAVLSLLILLAKKKYETSVLLVTFFILSLWQVRHIPFYVFVALPSFSYAFFYLGAHAAKKIKSTEDVTITIYGSLLFLLVLATGFCSSNWIYNTYDMNKRFGIGFSEDGKNAVDFFEKNSLKGPIFNNFDIGGYLIYRLYPQNLVFVDNRPEAYPSDFFQKIYIPLHLDRSFRSAIFEKYGIRTILYSHTDQTQWAHTLLEQLYKDLSWKLVYFDNSTIVFTHDTPLPDLRGNKKYAENLIQKESNYYKLLQLSKVLQIFEDGSNSDKAFQKAKEINSSSCSIQKGLYNSYIGNLYLTNRAKKIMEDFWYCF